MSSDVLVLWDIDGTLLDAGGVGRDLYGTVFRALFGRPLDACAPMAGRTDRAIVRETLALAGVPSPRQHVDAFIAALGARAPSVRSALVMRGRVLPGAAQALAGLRLAGVRQTVLTGNIRPLAEVKLGALGLGDGLDLAIGAYGDDHEERAELVHLARRRAVSGGRSTVIVGDTPLDVAAALAAGARAVGVATGSYPAADLLTAGAHAVLPDLTDTARVLRTLLGP